MQDVRIWNIQDRSPDPKTRKPFLVRWQVDGAPHSRSFRTKAEGDRFRSRLLIAQHDGERFDRRTGEPVSWLPAGEDVQLHEWARTWVREQWLEWEPRTRDTDVYALARFIPLAIDAKASKPPAGLRLYLRETLVPDVEIDPSHECERWLARWVLSLGELDKAALADVDRRLGIGDAGQKLANSTASRFRKVAKSCVRRAWELEKIPADPWPPAPKGRSQRKANRRSRQAVDIRRLPDRPTMVLIIEGIRSHQPGSENYRMMTDLVYDYGLRPSETAMLRPKAFYLPETGWGYVDVVEADDGYDEPTEPKTGPRRVPLRPQKVVEVRSWIEERNLGPNDLMFRTRNGKRPTQSNWNRAIKRSCRKVNQARQRVAFLMSVLGPGLVSPLDEIALLDPYAGRHACATEWIRAGVPLGTAALWLGHSVETLVSIYIGALADDDAEAKRRIEVLHADDDQPGQEGSPHTLPTETGQTRNNKGKGGQRQPPG